MNNYVYALWHKGEERVTVGEQKVNPFEILIQADAETQAEYLLSKYLLDHGMGKYETLKVREYPV